MRDSSSTSRCPRTHEHQELENKSRENPPREDKPWLHTVAASAKSAPRRKAALERNPIVRDVRKQVDGKANRCGRRSGLRVFTSPFLLPPFLSSCSASSAGKLSSFRPAAPASSGYTWFPTHALRLSTCAARIPTTSAPQKVNPRISLAPSSYSSQSHLHETGSGRRAGFLQQRDEDSPARPTSHI